MPEDTEATDPDGAAWRVSSCPIWRAVPGRWLTLTVPVSISGASQLFMVSLTVTFDPSVLRVRTVQEGGSMRLGGAQVSFTQQVDTEAGLIRFTSTRDDDITGAVGPGSVTLDVNGTVATPGEGPR